MQSDAASPDATDIAAQTERLAKLAYRTMATTAQVQGHSFKQASGSEYSLMDASTLAKAYGTFWTDMMSHPQKLIETQMTLGTEMVAAWQSFFSAPAWR